MICLFSATLFSTANAQTGLVSTPAGAIVRCPSSTYLGITIQNQAGAEPLVCADFQSEVEDILSRVQKLSSTPFPAPYLIVDNAAGASYYIWTQQTLHFSFSKGALTQRLPVLAHELGHAVFSQYLIDRVSAYSVIAGDMNSYRNYVENCWNSQMNSATLEVCEDFSVMNSYFEKSGAWTNDLSIYSQLDNAYNELFADVIAALVYEDPEIMVKTTQSRFSDLVSFSHEIDIPEEALSDRHYQLSGLRFPLWNKILFPQLSEKSKALEFVANFFIVDFVQNAITDYQLSDVELSRQRTARLLKSF